MISQKFYGINVVTIGSFKKYTLQQFSVVKHDNFFEKTLFDDIFLKKAGNLAILSKFLAIKALGKCINEFTVTVSYIGVSSSRN